MVERIEAQSQPVAEVTPTCTIERVDVCIPAIYREVGPVLGVKIEISGAGTPEQVDRRVAQCRSTAIVGHTVAAHNLGDLMLSNTNKIECTCDRSVIGIECIASSAAEPYPTINARSVCRAQAQRLCQSTG
jgi:hypothetical protein